MKSRDVQRAVRVQRFDRSPGDAPSLGRMARLPGTGLPRVLKRKRKSGQSGRGNRDRDNRTRVILTWSLLAGVMAVGVLVVTFVLWLRPKMAPLAADHSAGPVEMVIAKRVVSEFESPSEDEALALVRRALAIRKPGKVADQFHPGSASAEEVVDFLREMKAEDGPTPSLAWLSSMDANGLLIDGVLVKTSAGSQLRNRLALLTPDDRGIWKIDFEAFARVVEPSWGELSDGTAAEGVVRVIVAEDSYYNGPFRDDSEWVCYGMASPDTEVVMLGYCRKGSPQARAMARIVSDEYSLPGNVSLNRATLRVRRHEGAEARQFEISRVLAEDWVRSATVFDENFP